MSKKSEKIQTLLHEASMALSVEQFESAEIILNQALKINPRHPIALANMALIAQKKSEHQKAKEFFKKALLYDPDQYEIRNAYGVLLFAQEDFLSAKVEFEKACKLSNYQRQPTLHLAMTLSRLSEKQKAIELYNHLIEKNNKDIDAYRGKLDHYEYHSNKDLAALTITQFLQIEPENLEFILRGGILKTEINKHQEALTFFDKALEIEPRNKIALFNKAATLKKINRTSDAIDLYKNYENLYGTSYDLNYNLANAYDDLGDFKAAVSRYEACLSASKHNPDIFQNLSEALANMGEFKKAESIYQDALELFPHSSPLKFGYSLLSLKLGHFEEGWKYYEERWRDPLKQEKFKKYQPYFTDISDIDQFRGRSVLLLSEQGGGDVVMFLSVLEDLKNYTTNITILAFDRLLKLLSNSFHGCQFISLENYNPELVSNYDIFIPCGRLPTLFRKERGDFNGRPYLSASRESVSRFSEHLKQQRNKIKIGISWRGGTVDTRTRHRSLSISELQPLLSLPNCHFVSLQYAVTEAEQQELGHKQYDNLTIFDGDTTNDFDDLAGLIANLDCVVTVQNTNVHIAGSLGKKCFVMLPMSPEWRYGASGTTMPWYGSVELYRQDQSGNWNAVLGEVIKRVENYCNELRVGWNNVADA